MRGVDYNPDPIPFVPGPGEEYRGVAIQAPLPLPPLPRPDRSGD